MTIGDSIRSKARREALEPWVAAALLGIPVHGAGPDPDPSVVEELVRLGLAGLLVSDAEAAGAEHHLPARWLEELRTATHRSAFETTLRLESGHRALELLAEAGVPVLLLKGAALHRQGIHPQPRARPMTDVDLLVTPERADDAVRALTAGGFEPWESWTPHHLEWISAFTLEDTSTAAGVPCTIDLHWATDYGRLRHGPDAGRDTLWDGSDPPLPSAEAHFVLTAEHFLKHLRVAVHFPALADLIRLLPSIRHPDELRRQASERGSLPGLVALLGALDGLGASVDPEIWSAVAGRSRATLAAGIARLSLPTLLDRVDGEASTVRDWVSLRGVAGTLAELVRVVFPPRDWLRARYPELRGEARRRLRYLGDFLRWTRARGGSPLSPNQELS